MKYKFYKILKILNRDRDGETETEAERERERDGNRRTKGTLNPRRFLRRVEKRGKEEKR